MQIGGQATACLSSRLIALPSPPLPCTGPAVGVVTFIRPRMDWKKRGSGSPWEGSARRRSSGTPSSGTASLTTSRAARYRSLTHTSTVSFSAKPGLRGPRARSAALAGTGSSRGPRQGFQPPTSSSRQGERDRDWARHRPAASAALFAAAHCNNRPGDRRPPTLNTQRHRAHLNWLASVPRTASL